MAGVGAYIGGKWEVRTRALNVHGRDDRDAAVLVDETLNLNEKDPDPPAPFPSPPPPLPPKAQRGGDSGEERTRSVVPPPRTSAMTRSALSRPPRLGGWRLSRGGEAKPLEFQARLEAAAMLAADAGSRDARAKAKSGKKRRSREREGQTKEKETASKRQRKRRRKRKRRRLVVLLVFVVVGATKETEAEAGAKEARRA